MTGERAAGKCLASGYPVLQLPARGRTMRALCDSVAQGRGLVALVGEPGSGRSLLLAALEPAFGPVLSAAAPGLAARCGPLPASVLIDDVDGAALALLRAQRRDRGVVVVVIGTGLLSALAEAFPQARIVRVWPLGSADVRMMAEDRRHRGGLGTEALPERTATRLEELCAGNPGRLDRLLTRCGLVLLDSGRAQLMADDVDMAARQLGLHRGAAHRQPRLQAGRRARGTDTAPEPDMDPDMAGRAVRVLRGVLTGSSADIRRG